MGIAGVLICPVECSVKYCSAQAPSLSDLSQGLRTAVLCSALSRAENYACAGATTTSYEDGRCRTQTCDAHRTAPDRPWLQNEEEPVESPQASSDAPPPYSSIAGENAAFFDYKDEPGFPKPPSYNVATSLPSYDEAERTKAEATIPLVPGRDDDFVARDDFDDADQLRIGNDGIFMLTFFMAFLFNWIGFFLSFCLTTSAAGRYGAISGFGLSLIKWILIVRLEDRGGTDTEDMMPMDRTKSIYRTYRSGESKSFPPTFLDILMGNTGSGGCSWYWDSSYFLEDLLIMQRFGRCQKTFPLFPELGFSLFINVLSSRPSCLSRKPSDEKQWHLQEEARNSTPRRVKKYLLYQRKVTKKKFFKIAKHLK
ncbi:unnamed protein product [Ranitomeya imitator]|uniref:Nedd4 family interacting protein 1 n=1 Tax=Ranitomeya imitator TaxID=111125 RepID=A0ABN9L8A3_9NEOB|nr:unnamed protein product [Ranitomeya imitator]